jgi:hypothetical protein
MLLLRIILILSLVGQLARPPELIFRRDLCGEIATDKPCGSAPASPSAAASPCGAKTAGVGGCGGSPCGPAADDAPPGCSQRSALRNLTRLSRVLATCSEPAPAAEPSPPPKKSSCGCGPRSRTPDPNPRPCDDESPVVVVVVQTEPGRRCPTGNTPARCCERVPAPPRKPADQQPTLVLQKIPTTPLPNVAAADTPGRPPFSPGAAHARGLPPPTSGERRPTLCVWRN